MTRELLALEDKQKLSFFLPEKQRSGSSSARGSGATQSKLRAQAKVDSGLRRAKQLAEMRLAVAAGKENHWPRQASKTNVRDVTARLLTSCFSFLVCFLEAISDERSLPRSRVRTRSREDARACSTQSPRKDVACSPEAQAAGRFSATRQRQRASATSALAASTCHADRHSARPASSCRLHSFHADQQERAVADRSPASSRRVHSHDRFARNSSVETCIVRVHVLYVTCIVCCV